MQTTTPPAHPNTGKLPLLPIMTRPLQEARDEVAREKHVRESCYPRWIGDGRISATDACDRSERITCALQALDWMLAASRAGALPGTIQPEP